MLLLFKLIISLLELSELIFQVFDCLGVLKLTEPLVQIFWHRVEGGLQIGGVLTLLVEESLELACALAHSCLDLFVDGLDCGLEGGVEVSLLTMDRLLQCDALLLNRLDKN